jgi:hypothetical protein
MDYIYKMKKRQVKVGLIMGLDDPQNNMYKSVKVLKHPLPLHYKNQFNLTDYAIVEGTEPISSPFIIKATNLI